MTNHYSTREHFTLLLHGKVDYVGIRSGVPDNVPYDSDGPRVEGEKKKRFMGLFQLGHVFIKPQGHWWSYRYDHTWSNLMIGDGLQGHCESSQRVRKGYPFRPSKSVCHSSRPTCDTCVPPFSTCVCGPG